MKALFSNDDIHRAILRVEDACAVDRWRVGDLRVWPLVRVIISADTTNFGRQPAQPPGTASLVQRFPVASLIDMARTRSRHLATRLLHPESQTALHRADALMYGDGVSYVRADGRFFDRLLDPLALLLQARGLTSCFVTPASGFHAPRTSPTFFAQPSLNHARIRARLRARVRRPILEGPDVERALEVLRAQLPGAPIRPASYYAMLAVYLEVFQEEFARILDVVRPSMVFVVSYYGPEAMGLIRAARERGIVSVDVQHGLITENHLAYSGAERVPAAGYDVHPHAFWVWSQEEAGVIRRWTQGLPQAPEPIVGGNLLLEAWREGRLPWVKAALAQVREVRADVGAVKHAVFTLQGFETDADMRELAAVAARTRGELYWWFRLHPVHPEARVAMEAALRAVGADNASVQASTDLPLYAVLSEADVHVTRYSSSVMEAAAFRVPSVVISRRDSTFFGPEIERGWAVVGEGVEGILSALKFQLAATPRLRAAAAALPAVDPEAALDRLLAFQRRLHDEAYDRKRVSASR